MVPLPGSIAGLALYNAVTDEHGNIQMNGESRSLQKTG